MLEEDSILRQVPAAINPKQALFIDGIRHAAEIITLAYERLRGTLTEMALNPPSTSEIPKVSTRAFLDAWAMIDAIDRFRMLYLQMPGISFSQSEEGIETLEKVLTPFRNLRNVADHIAQRADFIVSRGSAALGSLSWLTGFKVDPITAWYCTLRPGTLRKQPELGKEPLVSTLDWPTDRIIMVAGGHEGNLSSVRSHIQVRVNHFEGQLKEAFTKLNLQDSPAASDVFTRQAFSPTPGQIIKE
ncbi:MAG: hypothetical protein KKB30_15895 [Proteobacteria bacterium]|nr:hypothetical protein [Pseudomonadota bacterium]MBU1717199.1 hypothetical protein [Pseudomonadota bacterium]